MISLFLNIYKYNLISQYGYRGSKKIKSSSK